ncbi:MAG: A/G-specific adenine glycosylase [Pelistega sp.]|nr:A/G-specific adenine glycosylase [Pelistega sp.]
MADFVTRLVTWQKAHGRHDLPWQLSRDPYRVWLSEIMLQQTQVNTVMAYYQRFLERFPTVESLAAVAQEELMPYWAGLGYYARARNLHRCAQIICQEYAGQFPSDPEVLQSLPGIGKSTANAIAAFCFNAPTPIMDGNVKRVFTRYYGITGTGSATEKQLWHQAYVNAQGQVGLGSYNQALMDLGSSICKRSKPQCTSCPLQQDCFAFKHNAQAELPTRKVKKSIPTRHCHMLVLQKGSQVLLQIRPSKGIWGGLLSLPEFSDGPELEQTLIAQGLEVGQAMAAFEHVFSHFRLIIQPQLVQLGSASIEQAVDNYRINGNEHGGEHGNEHEGELITRPPQAKPSRTHSPTLSIQEPSAQLVGDWYDIEQAEALALPAPVLKILQGVRDL